MHFALQIYANLKHFQLYQYTKADHLIEHAHFFLPQNHKNPSSSK